MSVDAEDLLAELRLKSAGDAHDRGERRHAEGHAENGEGGAYGNERAPFGAEVAQRNLDRVTHVRRLAERASPGTRQDNFARSANRQAAGEREILGLRRACSNVSSHRFAVPRSGATFGWARPR